MTEVRLEQRQIMIDGTPVMIGAGEIHYFRLARSDWESRLAELRAAGANAVATYVPWVVHQRGDGEIDLRGTTDPTLDLGAFIDLAAEQGLYVILRPGPFVMAEMANEGIPDAVRAEHPEAIPLGWEGRPAPTGDLDYLDPGYLTEVQRWYGAVGEIAAPRMAPRGGPVIAVQLDNEIGMLAWVANAPQLTDRAVGEFGPWLRRRYDDDGLAARYPGLAVPDAARASGFAGFADFAAAIRNPRPEWATALRLDLGRFFRDQFARYVGLLAEYADAAAMGGVPYLVNIHGTEAGSGASFPIGISQLVETYQNRPQFAAGSDHYLGDMNLRTAADLHLMNAFMAAVNGPDQPGTALEFETGNGDYGDDLWNDVDPSAVLLKTRLSLAQGLKLINYYLFAGGTNFFADPPRSDGTTRFAITGERHGFAAPLTPEGARSGSYEPTAEALELMTTTPDLTTAFEEHDDVALGLILDDYLTEYRPPDSPVDTEAIADLKYARGAGPRGILTRVLLTLGYRYGAVDLQNLSVPLPKLVVLGSPSGMDRAVQHRLADHLADGGSLLLAGRLPVKELDGTPCFVLADALGLRVGGEEHDRPGWFTSVQTTAGWGWGTERRVGQLEWYEIAAGRQAEVVLTEAISGQPVGVFLTLPGGGRALMIGCDFGADLGFWAQGLTRLGVEPGLRREPIPGLIATTTRSADGTQLLHALNVSGRVASSSYELEGTPLFDGEPVTLAPRTGTIVPIYPVV
ncbi:MAG: beta-galactosidase [Promicromonosporaceae bacterium]|nr:beta-galactosidase [Promicromonosporaceae bacterium]